MAGLRGRKSARLSPYPSCPLFRDPGSLVPCSLRLSFAEGRSPNPAWWSAWCVWIHSPAAHMTTSSHSFTSIYEFLLCARPTTSGTGRSLNGIGASHHIHESTRQDTWTNIQRWSWASALDKSLLQPINGALPVSHVVGLKEIMPVKCSAQVLAHSKYSTNISCPPYYYYCCVHEQGGTRELPSRCWR